MNFRIILIFFLGCLFSCPTTIVKRNLSGMVLASAVDSPADVTVNGEGQRIPRTKRAARFGDDSEEDDDDDDDDGRRTHVRRKALQKVLFKLRKLPLTKTQLMKLVRRLWEYRKKKKLVTSSVLRKLIRDVRKRPVTRKTKLIPSKKTTKKTETNPPRSKATKPKTNVITPKPKSPLLPPFQSKLPSVVDGHLVSVQRAPTKIETKKPIKPKPPVQKKTATLKPEPIVPPKPIPAQLTIFETQPQIPKTQHKETNSKTLKSDSTNQVTVIKEKPVSEIVKVAESKPKIKPLPLPKQISLPPKRNTPSTIQVVPVSDGTLVKIDTQITPELKLNINRIPVHMRTSTFMRRLKVLRARLMNLKRFRRKKTHLKVKSSESVSTSLSSKGNLSRKLTFERHRPKPTSPSITNPQIRRKMTFQITTRKDNKKHAKVGKSDKSAKVLHTGINDDPSKVRLGISNLSSAPSTNRLKLDDSSKVRKIIRFIQRLVAKKGGKRLRVSAKARKLLIRWVRRYKLKKRTSKSTKSHSHKIKMVSKKDIKDFKSKTIDQVGTLSLQRNIPISSRAELANPFSRENDIVKERIPKRKSGPGGVKIPSYMMETHKEKQSLPTSVAHFKRISKKTIKSEDKITVKKPAKTTTKNEKSNSNVVLTLKNKDKITVQKPAKTTVKTKKLNPKVELTLKSVRQSSKDHDHRTNLKKESKPDKYTINVRKSIQEENSNAVMNNHYTSKKNTLNLQSNFPLKSDTLSVNEKSAYVAKNNLPKFTNAISDVHPSIPSANNIQTKQDQLDISKSHSKISTKNYVESVNKIEKHVPYSSASRNENTKSPKNEKTMDRKKLKESTVPSKSSKINSIRGSIYTSITKPVASHKHVDTKHTKPQNKIKLERNSPAVESKFENKKNVQTLKQPTTKLKSDAVVNGSPKPDKNIDFLPADLAKKSSVELFDKLYTTQTSESSRNSNHGSSLNQSPTVIKTVEENPTFKKRPDVMADLSKSPFTTNIKMKKKGSFNENARQISKTSQKASVNIQVHKSPKESKTTSGSKLDTKVSKIASKIMLNSHTPRHEFARIIDNSKDNTQPSHLDAILNFVPKPRSTITGSLGGSTDKRNKQAQIGKEKTMITIKTEEQNVLASKSSDLGITTLPQKSQGHTIKSNNEVTQQISNINKPNHKFQQKKAATKTMDSQASVGMSLDAILNFKPKSQSSPSLPSKSPTRVFDRTSAPSLPSKIPQNVLKTSKPLLPSKIPQSILTEITTPSLPSKILRNVFEETLAPSLASKPLLRPKIPQNVFAKTPTPLLPSKIPHNIFDKPTTPSLPSEILQNAFEETPSPSFLPTPSLPSKISQNIFAKTPTPLLPSTIPHNIFYKTTTPSLPSKILQNVFDQIPSKIPQSVSDKTLSPLIPPTVPQILQKDSVKTSTPSVPSKILQIASATKPQSLLPSTTPETVVAETSDRASKYINNENILSRNVNILTKLPKTFPSDTKPKQKLISRLETPTSEINRSTRIKSNVHSILGTESSLNGFDIYPVPTDSVLTKVKTDTSSQLASTAPEPNFSDAEETRTFSAVQTHVSISRENEISRTEPTPTLSVHNDIPASMNNAEPVKTNPSSGLAYNDNIGATVLKEHLNGLAVVLPQAESKNIQSSDKQQTVNIPQSSKIPDENFNLLKIQSSADNFNTIIPTAADFNVESRHGANNAQTWFAQSVETTNPQVDTQTFPVQPGITIQKQESSFVGVSPVHTQFIPTAQTPHPPVATQWTVQSSVSTRSPNHEQHLPHPRTHQPQVDTQTSQIDLGFSQSTRQQKTPLSAQSTFSPTTRNPTSKANITPVHGQSLINSPSQFNQNNGKLNVPGIKPSVGETITTKLNNRRVFIEPTHTMRPPNDMSRFGGLGMNKEDVLRRLMEIRKMREQLLTTGQFNARKLSDLLPGSNGNTHTRNNPLSSISKASVVFFGDTSKHSLTNDPNSKTVDASKHSLTNNDGHFRSFRRRRSTSNHRRDRRSLQGHSQMLDLPLHYLSFQKSRIDLYGGLGSNFIRSASSLSYSPSNIHSSNHFSRTDVANPTNSLTMNPVSRQPNEGVSRLEQFFRTRVNFSPERKVNDVASVVNEIYAPKPKYNIQQSFANTNTINTSFRMRPSTNNVRGSSKYNYEFRPQKANFENIYPTSMRNRLKINKNRSGNVRTSHLHSSSPMNHVKERKWSETIRNPSIAPQNQIQRFSMFGTGSSSRLGTGQPKPTGFRKVNRIVILPVNSPASKTHQYQSQKGGSKHGYLTRETPVTKPFEVANKVEYKNVNLDRTGGVQNTKEMYTEAYHSGNKRQSSANVQNYKTGKPHTSKVSVGSRGGSNSMTHPVGGKGSSGSVLTEELDPLTLGNFIIAARESAATNQRINLTRTTVESPNNTTSDQLLLEVPDIPPYHGPDQPIDTKSNNFDPTHDHHNHSHHLFDHHTSTLPPTTTETPIFGPSFSITKKLNIRRGIERLPTKSFRANFKSTHLPSQTTVHGKASVHELSTSSSTGRHTEYPKPSVVHSVKPTIKPTLGILPSLSRPTSVTSQPFRDIVHNSISLSFPVPGTEKHFTNSFDHVLNAVENITPEKKYRKEKQYKDKYRSNKYDQYENGYERKQERGHTLRPNLSMDSTFLAMIRKLPVGNVPEEKKKLLEKILGQPKSVTIRPGQTYQLRHKVNDHTLPRYKGNTQSSPRYRGNTRSPPSYKENTRPTPLYQVNSRPDPTYKVNSRPDPSNKVTPSDNRISDPYYSNSEQHSMLQQRFMKFVENNIRKGKRRRFELSRSGFANSLSQYTPSPSQKKKGDTSKGSLSAFLLAGLPKDLSI